MSLILVHQGHPFWIKTDQINGTSDSYNEGIINNGLSSWKVNIYCLQPMHHQHYIIFVKFTVV